MKTCTKCKKSQANKNFPKSGGGGKLSSWCRGCHSQRAKGLKEDLAKSNLEFLSTDPIGMLEKELNKQNLTKRWLADKVGVNEQNVYKWFNGKIMPRQKNLLAMYDALGVELPVNLKLDEEGRIPLGVGDCPNCGIRFPIYKSGKKFCSRECQGVALSKRQHGVNNHNYNGGEFVTNAAGGGYIKELAPNHPNADASGYVMQHRLVVERELGIILTSKQRVHHKNGDRKDNRPENLELWVGAVSSKKDPHGVRVVDKVLDMLTLLKPDELQRIADKIKELQSD